MTALRPSPTGTAVGRAQAAAARPAPAPRSGLRAVALPTEHGGWGLTLEPGLLGMLVAPSTAGLLLAAAAMVAFLARTPLKLVAVDLRRGRRTSRTALAAGVGAIEVALLLGLIGGAVAAATHAFWWPLAVATPLIAVEAAYEVRSRGRRLVPELAGAAGVSAVAAASIVAATGDHRLAAAAWLVLTARVATSIPHVRSQIGRLRGRSVDRSLGYAADGAAAALAALAVLVDVRALLGALAVLAVVALQRRSAVLSVPPPKVLGLRQMAYGLGVVAVTALGTHLL